MYYRSGTDVGHVHSPDGSSFQCEMMSWLGYHLEVVTSYRQSDSVSRCVFTWRIFLPNFIPIQFETTALWAFKKRSPQQEQQQEQDE